MDDLSCMEGVTYRGAFNTAESYFREESLLAVEDMQIKSHRSSIFGFKNFLHLDEISTIHSLQPRTPGEETFESTERFGHQSGTLSMPK